MYKEEHTSEFLESLRNCYGSSIHIAPEGSTDVLTVKGHEKILTEEDKVFDATCTAVGIGGTISGLIDASAPHQQVIGFPVLKGEPLIGIIK